MLKNIIKFSKRALLALCLGAVICSGCKNDEPENTDRPTTGEGKVVIKFGGQVLSNNQELDLGVSLVNMPTELIFDVENIGSETIKFTGKPTVNITTESSTYQGFKVSQELPSILWPNGKSQFIVVYNPTMPGNNECAVNIYTNDIKAPLLTVKLHATARIHAPEMKVYLSEIVNGEHSEINNILLANGSESYRLGQVEMNQPMDLTFTITNTGTSELALGDDQSIISISNETAFSLLMDVSKKKLNYNESTTFKVRYLPKTLGTHVTTINIENDDPENSPYTISLLASSFQGEVKQLPEITVGVNGYNIESGTKDILIGSQLVNDSIEVKMSIKNDGNADLNLGDKINNKQPLSISQTTECFSVKQQPQIEVLEEGRNTNAALLFHPTTVGRCCATVTLTNNDPDEGNFVFSLCGDGYEKSTSAAITGYTVELHQNIGKTSHKVINYTFTTDLTMGTYIIFARSAADLASWAKLFTPELTAEQLEKVSLYWQISDPENGGTWESNGNDDVVIIKDPSGNIIDKSAVSENAHKVRDFATVESETLDAATEFDGNEGHYVLGLTTNGATGAPDPLMSNDGKSQFDHPIYIYEIGERGKNNSLGGTTQLNNVNGNYVMFYLPANN